MLNFPKILYSVDSSSFLKNGRHQEFFKIVFQFFPRLCHEYDSVFKKAKDKQIFMIFHPKVILKKSSEGSFDYSEKNVLEEKIHFFCFKAHKSKF